MSLTKIVNNKGVTNTLPRGSPEVAGKREEKIWLIFKHLERFVR